MVFKGTRDNINVLSCQFQMNKNEIEICDFELHLKIFFGLPSNLSNDDKKFAQRPGLRTGWKITFFGLK